jgi:hypothetical protein
MFQAEEVKNMILKEQIFIVERIEQTLQAQRSKRRLEVEELQEEHASKRKRALSEDDFQSQIPPLPLEQQDLDCCNTNLSVAP